MGLPPPLISSPRKLTTKENLSVTGVWSDARTTEPRCPPLLLHPVGKTERVLSGSWVCHTAIILWSTPCLLDPQTIQALDDMLHALVMEHRSPNMLILQNFIEVGGCRKQNPTLIFVHMQGKAGGEKQSSAPLGQRFSSPGMCKHHWRTQSCVVSLKTLCRGHLETTVVRLRSLYCLELGHAGTLAALFMLFLPSLHWNLLSVFRCPVTEIRVPP